MPVVHSAHGLTDAPSAASLPSHAHFPVLLLLPLGPTLSIDCFIPVSALASGQPDIRQAVIMCLQELA